MECKCCCTLCGKNYQWRRRVKRKVEDLYYEIRGASDNVKVEVDVANELIALQEVVQRQLQTIEELSSELEEERDAAASATDEAMSMITRLQKEKAEVQMEASQFKRFAEGKFAHDQQELAALENLTSRKQQMIKALECEIQAFKHRMLSIGLVEHENVKVRSPGRSQLGDGEDWLYLLDPSCSKSNSCAEPADIVDFYDGQIRDSPYRPPKEAKSGRVCLDRSEDSLQTQLQLEGTFSPRDRDIGSSCFHSLQSNNYSSSTQFEDCILNGRHYCHKSNVDDVKNIVRSSNKKSLEDSYGTLWEYIKVLEERVQQLEKRTHHQHLDSEWPVTRKLPPKKQAAYSGSSKNGSQIWMPSPDGVSSSDRMIGSSEESSEQDDGLSNIMAKNSYSRTKHTDLPLKDKGIDGTPSTDNIFESQNSSEACSGHQPNKGNADCLEECDSLCLKREACVAAKEMLLNEQVTCSPNPGERSRPIQTLSAVKIKECSKENEKLPSMKMIPELSNTGNAAFTKAMENLTNRKFKSDDPDVQNESAGNTGNAAFTKAMENLNNSKFKSDDPDVQNESAGSRRCKAVNESRDWQGDPELSPQQDNGDRSERTPYLTERREGSNMTAFPVELATKPDIGPVQNEVKQLVLRIQALEEERQSMKQAIMYFERENSSCLALLKEIARLHYEVQIPDKEGSDTTRMRPSDGLSILFIIKWILSYVFRRNTQGHESKYMHGVSSHSVGLQLLLENTHKQRLEAYITRVGICMDPIHCHSKNVLAETRL